MSVYRNGKIHWKFKFLPRFLQQLTQISKQNWSYEAQHRDGYHVTDWSCKWRCKVVGIDFVLVRKKNHSNKHEIWLDEKNRYQTITKLIRKAQVANQLSSPVWNTSSNKMRFELNRAENLLENFEKCYRFLKFNMFVLLLSRKLNTGNKGKLFKCDW